MHMHTHIGVNQTFNLRMHVDARIFRTGREELARIFRTGRSHLQNWTLASSELARIFRTGSHLQNWARGSPTSDAGRNLPT